jgi:hypothetical protein
MIISQSVSSIRLVRIRQLLIALALLVVAPASAHAAQLLPDLDQAVPRNIIITDDKSGAVPRYDLGFTSSFDNVGAGPLIIDAHRESASDPMVADQTIDQDDGTTTTVPHVGELQYVYSSDHQHWHYLGFDHYQLRRATDNKFVAPDRKTGFCVGDRYATHPGKSEPGKPPEPALGGDCGSGDTTILSLREGISVGYGDIYYATIEGQFVDITGVKAGRYYLVHHVNANQKLRESDYSNNYSSALLDISWPYTHKYEPRIKILRRCPDTATCPLRRKRFDSSKSVSQSRQRLVAFDHPLLDGIRFRPIVDEVPSFVRHPLGGLGSGFPAQ